jgi:hypothetical protein
MKKENTKNGNDNQVRSSFMAGWDDALVIGWNELTGEMFDENLETRGNAVSDQIDTLFLAQASKNPSFLRQTTNEMNCKECNKIFTSRSEWDSKGGKGYCKDCGTELTVNIIDRISGHNEWNHRAGDLISAIIGNMGGEE